MHATLTAPRAARLLAQADRCRARGRSLILRDPRTARGWFAEARALLARARSA